MNRFTMPLGAAAVMLIAAIVGCQPLSGPSGPVSPSTASPSPTSVPNVIPLTPSSGPIAAGTYRMRGLPFVIVTVPAGWEGAGTDIRKHWDEPTEVGLYVFLEEIWVFADSCVTGTEQLIGPTAQDLIDALLAQKNTQVSEPVDARIGALSARQVRIRIPPGLDANTCSDPGLHIWNDPTHTNNLAIPPDPQVVVTVFMADTPAGRVVVTLGSSPESTAADIAELDAIFDSIRLE